MIKAYLISVLLCFAVLIITCKAASHRAKREGYKPKHKQSIWEKIQTCLPMFVPVFNILIMLVAIFKYEEAYELMVAKMERINPVEVQDEE